MWEGRVRAVLDGAGPVTRARRDGARAVDLGEALLAPALIDAHAHLDLTALSGRVPPEGGFGAWVARLLQERSTTSEADLRAGVRRGADRLLATGTAWVGDIDTARVAPEVLAAHPLGAVCLREALDLGDPARRRAVLAELDVPLPSLPGRREGLSPHAPFTVGRELLGELGRRARDRRLPVAIHWSETEEEVRWLRDGTGPLAELLGESPRTSGLDLIEAAGLLGPDTVLVHGNHPLPGEPERLAAAGVTLVHCPGTHRFFGREPAPLAAYRRAGVALALGTDSRASNEDLDMRREMTLLRASHPSLAPLGVWRMATEGGARALGLDTGRVRVGARADVAAYEVRAESPEAALEELTAGVPAVRGVWIGGIEAVA